MDRVERIAIEHECTRVVYAYCYLIDGCRHAELVRLWASDGVWETRAGTKRGHLEIRSYLDARDTSIKGWHTCAGVLIEAIDRNSARGRSYVAYYEGLAAPALVGEYLDEFRKVDDGWRFARRQTVVTMLR
jgi:hypothetical protein